MEFITYQKFVKEEEALPIIEVLETNQINYQIENLNIGPDITMTGGSGLDHTLALKIKTSDFDVLNGLLETNMGDNFEGLLEDHFLLEFNNDELLNVIRKFDEWNSADVLLAQKLLHIRGMVTITDDYVQALKDKRMQELRQPEEGKKAWTIIGFISALLGGFVGIFIGYHFFLFKKTLPNGERVFVYDTPTRQNGMYIFYIGILASVFSVIAAFVLK